MWSRRSTANRVALFALWFDSSAFRKFGVEVQGAPPGLGPGNAGFDSRDSDREVALVSMAGRDPGRGVRFPASPRTQTPALGTGRARPSYTRLADGSTPSVRTGMTVRWTFFA